MTDRQQAKELRREALDAFANRRLDCARKISLALRESPNDGALLIADAQARAELGESRPFDRIEAFLDRYPDWVDGQKALAQLKIEFGADRPLAYLERALELLRDHPRLWHCYLMLLSSMNRNAEAMDKVAGLRRRIGDVPELCLLEARYAGLAGDPDRGAGLLGRLPDDVPDLSYQRVRNALQRGKADEAAKMLDHAQLGNDMRMWAMAELCWRAIGHKHHDWLLGAGSLVQSIDIDLDAQDFTALCDCLRKLHRTKAAPPSQSLRNGTQTRGHLHKREAQELSILFSKFKDALNRYSQAMPSLDVSHPLFCIASRLPVITASWSVRLADGGFHVPHMHSEGLLSSAFHLIFPANSDSEGSLELGRPPSDIALNLEPLDVIQPRVRCLILFPSFLYHSTKPFGRGERLSAVFDAA